MQTKIRQNKAYKGFVDEIAQLVQQNRTYAVKSVQRAANSVYWEIGKLIIDRQRQYGWGNAIVEKLSADLQEKVGSGQSWSPRNLRLMRQLYEEYAGYIDTPILNVKQASSNTKSVNVKQAVSDVIKSNVKQPVSHLPTIDLKQFIAEVPWGQNILIVQKVKDIQARLFYLNATFKNGWSRAVGI